MRFYRRREGNTRKRRCFLFWPMTIDGVTRWMEMAEWEERVGPGLWWTTTRWLDLEDADAHEDR